MKRTKTTGLVLGKFYPLHKGHQYLLSLAYHFVEQLSIVVEEIPNETIPVALRASWLESLFPNAHVLILSDFNPQQPSEHPDFWKIWQASLTRLVSKKIDYVFAGEAYGKTLAKHLQAEFIGPGERSLHAISGTEIRDKPYKHWQMLSEEVKPYYRKTVCICGPESTGKTTLSKELAAHFDANFLGNSFVPEFARGYLEALDRDLCSNDFFNIARGQAASEAALYSQSGPLQIVDTGVNASTIWHQFLMGYESTRLTAFCMAHGYDLYLLCCPDVTWVEDAIRYLPHQGRAFAQVLQKRLYDMNVNLIQVHGNWDERWGIALGACEDLLD